MKQRKVSYMVIAWALLLSSCAVKKEATMSSSDLTDKKWQLIELEGKAVADSINGKMPFLELHTEGNRYAASGGCNGIGGTYEFTKNNGIKFSQGLSTMMACADMHAERGLHKMFKEADRYRMENDTLLFSRGEGAPIAKFKLATVADNVEQASLDGTWELDYVQDPDSHDFDELYAQRKPTLTFEDGGEKVSGNSSCNNFSGSATVKGNTIRFSPLAMTKMACPGEGEGVFLQALKQVNTFDVQADALHLIMGDIAIMRFKKK